MVSYIEMASAAIKSLKERGGSSSHAIKKVLHPPARLPPLRSGRPCERERERKSELPSLQLSSLNACFPAEPPVRTSVCSLAYFTLARARRRRSTSRRTTRRSRSSSTSFARPSRPARPRAPSCRSSPRSSYRRPPRRDRRRRRCVCDRTGAVGWSGDSGDASLARPPPSEGLIVTP
jgi:hypothetical protein